MLTDQWQGFGGLPDYTDPSNIPTYLQDLFNVLASRAVPRYNTVAERDAELASPPNGAICSVAGVLYTRRANGWRRLYAENRTEAGSVSISFGGTPSGSASIAFATPFTAAPIVVARFASGTLSPLTLVSTSGVTKDGFTAIIQTAAGGNAGVARTVNWVAVGA